MAGKVEVPWAHERFVCDFRIANFGDAVRTDALAALRDEVPHARLEHETKGSEFARPRLGMPAHGIAHFQITFAPRGLRHGSQ